MTETSIYECPECGDRKMVDYSQQLAPTVWCNCNRDFKTMEIINDN